MKYRPDIDGLRAIAVLAVIFYHAKFPWIPGGFVGVDVFFVISGYLITSIILSDLEKGKFSVGQFYERRIRRIFPPLFVVIPVLLIFSAFIVMPQAFVDLGKSLVACSLFISNIFFFKSSGYFDGPAHTKPLLHTWSLSVEEQFYVIFPLLLWGVSKCRATVRNAMVIGLAIASFAACIWIVKFNTSMAFYLVPFRMWELLLGSILALRILPTNLTRPTREILGVAGGLAIGFGIFMLSETSLFPGFNALYPCLGATALIYVGGAGGSFVSQILSCSPFVGVGLISYALYLWHWPLLVLAREYNLRQLNLNETFGVIGVSVLLSYISWRFIEAPFRTRKLLPKRSQVFWFGGVLTLTAFLLGHWIQSSKGWPSRIPTAALNFVNGISDSSPRRKLCHGDDGHTIPYDDACICGSPQSPKRTIVWGDSFAAEFANSLGHELEKTGEAVVHLSQSSCLPMAHKQIHISEECAKYSDEIFNRILVDRRVHRVVLVSRYSHYGPEALAEFLTGARKLANSGKEVILTYPIPESSESVPTILATLAWRKRNLDLGNISRANFNIIYQSTIDQFDKVINGGGDIRALRLYEFLCNAHQCITHSDGKSLYFDESHLSLAGYRYLMPMILKEIDHSH